MKKAIKKRWIAALRSGDFKQGRTSLSCGGYYCCLGVLRYINNHHDTANRGGDNYLNDRQLDEFGLDHDRQIELACMNDNGKSFLEISKWIRTNL